MDASSSMVAGSDVLYSPPYGRTVPVPSADALRASEVQAPEVCDALAPSGGLLGFRGLPPSTAARGARLQCPLSRRGLGWPHRAHRLGAGACVFCHNREGQDLATTDNQQGGPSPDLLFDQEAVEGIHARSQPSTTPHQ